MIEDDRTEEEKFDDLVSAVDESLEEDNTKNPEDGEEIEDEDEEVDDDEFDEDDEDDDDDTLLDE